MSADIEQKEQLSVELIRLFHDNNLSLPTRTIYVGSTIRDGGDETGVDATMAELLIKNLHVLETMSSEPITILMNNVGGDAYHGMAICDAIRSSSCRVKIVVRGHAMSMGSVIFQAADERVIGAGATQMIHNGEEFIAGESKTALRRAQESERIIRWMEHVYLSRIREKHPKYTLAKLRKLLDHDTYLTADESVDLGLADSVG